MPHRTARARVWPKRQRSQYTCMATSFSMAMQALGIEHADEDTVNKVLGAVPMRGAAWEHVLAAANHYGCISTLRVPSTVRQLKAWCDAEIPVMIAWNPEGREWSHASLVYDVTDGLPEVRSSAGVYEDNGPGLYVWVADPNIPHPEKTYRVVHEDTFYSKWYEKWPNYLVRRPACAIQREITPDGRQVVASRRAGQTYRWSDLGPDMRVVIGELLDYEVLPHDWKHNTYDLLKKIDRLPIHNTRVRDHYKEVKTWGWEPHDKIERGPQRVREMAEDIEREGASAVPPIVLHKGKVLDGRHRIMAAHVAGLRELPAFHLEDLVELLQKAAGQGMRSSSQAGPAWARRPLSEWRHQLLDGLAPAWGVNTRDINIAMRRYAFELGAAGAHLPDWLRYMGELEGVNVRQSHASGTTCMPTRVLVDRVASRYLRACGGSCGCGGACGGSCGCINQSPTGPQPPR